MTGTWCAHGRSCQPVTIAGLEAPNATSTRLPVSEATVLAPSASVTGPRTPTASGPIFSRHARRAQPDRGRERERIVGGHFANPHRVEARRQTPPARHPLPRRRAGRARTAGRLRCRSQHRHVGRLVEQDPAGQLARCLVDLEVGGGRERVAEPTLQRCSRRRSRCRPPGRTCCAPRRPRSAPRAWPPGGVGCASPPAPGQHRWLACHAASIAS